MNTTGQLWQYSVVAIALAASLAGVLLHLFPRLHAGMRRAIATVLRHPAMPKRLQQAGQRWATAPRGGCANCASGGSDAPPAITRVSMPVSRRRKS